MSAAPNIMTSADINALAGNQTNNSIAGNLTIAGVVTAGTLSATSTTATTVAATNVTATGTVTTTGGLKIASATGVNAGAATAGRAQLENNPGTVTINTTAVKADSLIFLSHANSMGSSALYAADADIVAGVSFLVRHNAGGGNADIFNWLIINRA